jgi:hypothetical protein
MEREEIIRQAERMQRVARERLQPIPPLDDCIAHVTMCAEIGCRPGDWPLGTPRETIERKVKASKRRAGVRALARKYGTEGAERILEKKTGRHISIRC